MSLPILPLEILHIVYDLCYGEEKYSLSQTCKYFHKLKLKKPKRYYCSLYIDNPNYNLDDSDDDSDDNLEYMKTYKYFFHIENCLKYCDKIKYNSEYNTNGVSFIEIGFTSYLNTY